MGFFGLSMYGGGRGEAQARARRSAGWGGDREGAAQAAGDRYDRMRNKGSAGKGGGVLSSIPYAPHIEAGPDDDEATRRRPFDFGDEEPSSEPEEGAAPMSESEPIAAPAGLDAEGLAKAAAEYAAERPDVADTLEEFLRRLRGAGLLGVSSP